MPDGPQEGAHPAPRAPAVEDRLGRPQPGRREDVPALPTVLPGAEAGKPGGLLQPAGALGSGSWEQDFDVAGEPACMAHLICLSCGAVLSEGHHPGCSGP